MRANYEWQRELEELLFRRRGGRPRYNRHLRRKRYKPRPSRNEARLLIANALAADFAAELESLIDKSDYPKERP